jgi:hypothetical protein
MTAPPHLDAGRIYRLAPFDEVVTELQKTFASGPSVVPPQSVALGNGRLMLMPALVGLCAGVKMVTVKADSAVRGLYVTSRRRRSCLSDSR